MPEGKNRGAKKQDAKPKKRYDFGLLWFLHRGALRSALEIALSALPGAAIISVFLLAVGGLTINFNTNGFAASYIPVVCLLPVVLGIISPLILERIKGEEHVSLKSGILSAALSGFAGSAGGVLILLIFGMLNSSARPFGPSVVGLPYQLALEFFVVLLSTALSAAGGAILVVFIQKSSK